MFAAVLVHGQARLVIDNDDFRYTATFHSSRISEGHLRELLLFSPYDFSASSIQIDHQEMTVGFEETGRKLRKGPIAYSLEFCVDVDPRYRPCGARDISDANFLANAQINVERNEQIQAGLDRLGAPAELGSIAQQFRDSMIFFSTIERRRLEYLQTGDLRVLSQTVVALDPQKTCRKQIEELKEATTPQRRYELSRIEWTNCLVLEWDRLSPAYPREAWMRFLHAYGISEKYTSKPVD